jgi:hypothetical protein
MNNIDKAKRLAAIDAALERANEKARIERERVLAASSMRAPWSSSSAPNDRERELALRTVNESNRRDNSMPALITSFAHALAAYRIELTAQRKEPGTP